MSTKWLSSKPPTNESVEKRWSKRWSHGKCASQFRSAKHQPLSIHLAVLALAAGQRPGVLVASVTTSVSIVSAVSARPTDTGAHWSVALPAATEEWYDFGIYSRLHRS